MADIKRVNYFNYQFLVEGDFTEEQAYHIDMRRRLNRALHSWGAADGLTVTASGSRSVSISPGLAIDKDGREIVLAETRDYDLSATGADVDVYMTIEYGETPSDIYLNGGVEGTKYTRTTETPKIADTTTAPTPEDDGSVIYLAKITLAGGSISTVDNSARVSGGSDIAAGSVGTTQLANGAVTLDKLANSAKSASVDGVSNPGGDIDLVATNAISITGNNTAKTITIGESHSALTTNPHSTNALQVGALVSVEGVSNAGGNIDLVTANAITIAGNNTAKTITIGESHSALTTNPHATTAAQVGALASVEGVSNAGGNIDLVTANAITIAGNNTAKTITIGESHSASTTNPHSTTALQVGALVSVDGVSNAGGNIDLVAGNGITITPDTGLKKITIASASGQRLNADVQFTNADATNSTRTVNVGFQPNWVILTGGLQLQMGKQSDGTSAAYYGAPLSGFVDRVNIFSRGPAIYCNRYDSRDVEIFSQFTQNLVYFSSDYFETGMTKHRRELVYASITSWNSTGFVITLSRTCDALDDPIQNFTLYLNCLCLA